MNQIRQALIKVINLVTAGLVRLFLLTYLICFGDCYAQIKVDNDFHLKPIEFSLTHPGYVTLVIDDIHGVRVRNLVAESWFPAGKHIVWWDGLDDLSRDLVSAVNGRYRIAGNPVLPGTYNVRGIFHSKIKTNYEFSVYGTGNPPWRTTNHLGGWLANHTPPQGVTFVPANQSPTGMPAVFLGSYISEGPDGLAWVDLKGEKKGGRKWVGGVWTGAPYIARNVGALQDSDICVYVASVWGRTQSTHGELRITAIGKRGDKKAFTYDIGEIKNSQKGIMAEIGGLAVYNEFGLVSLTMKNKLVLVNLQRKDLVGELNLKVPKGIAVDKRGRILVISGKSVVRFQSIESLLQRQSPAVLVKNELQDPVGLALDSLDNIYVSDNGNNNQVFVFTQAGKKIRCIGENGPSQSGPYNPLHMNHPSGLAIDSDQQLWVAENDFLPKRVSVWKLNGTLIRDFYGPPKYGGGGSLDPQDRNSMYYSEGGKGAMVFKIDWKNGSYSLNDILYRNSGGQIPLASNSSGPETPIYYKGDRYFTNSFTSSPTSGARVAYIFFNRNGVLQPVAAFGSTSSWNLFKLTAFQNLVNPGNGQTKKKNFFIWSDLNRDGYPQPNEFKIREGDVNGVVVQNDLSFSVTRMNGNAVRFGPTRISEDHVPQYDIDSPIIVVKGVFAPGSTGGDQILQAENGWTIISQGVVPFAQFSITGVRDGKAMWSYPNLWPGLHAGHHAPRPTFSGELIATTRILGPMMENRGTQAGPLWAINSNHGMVYIFTADGLFVTTLFQSKRTGYSWTKLAAKRGTDLHNISLGEENFWPSIVQYANNDIYLVDGSRSSIIKVDGLQTITRLTGSEVTITESDLLISKKLRERQSESMVKQSPDVLTVGNFRIIVDGNFNDWKGSEWVNINDGQAQKLVKAAMSVNAGFLFVAFKTGEPALLTNSGENKFAPFHTGGALDIFLATDPNIDPKRRTAEKGDLRVCITKINQKVYALLYRPVVNSANEKEKILFSSPWRTLAIDEVKNISRDVRLASDGNGNFEIAIPLSLINLVPSDGLTLRADIGIIKGNGTEVIERLYWSNKSSNTVVDIPSEAEFSPDRWGVIQFQK